MQSPKCNNQPYKIPDFMSKSTQTKLRPLIQNALKQDSRQVRHEVIHCILSENDFTEYEKIHKTHPGIHEKRSWRMWVESVMVEWKSNTKSAHNQQAPSVEDTALNNSGAMAAAGGASRFLETASDDKGLMKAQKKQATYLTAALPVTGPAEAGPQLPADREALMQELKSDYTKLETDMQKLMQSFKSKLEQTMAIMCPQPCASAVHGAAVGTTKKRKLQEKADSTGPAKTKMSRAAKKPVGSGSSDHSSDRDDEQDVCSKCFVNIPTDQVYCTRCENLTESENSGNED